MSKHIKSEMKRIMKIADSGGDEDRASVGDDSSDGALCGGVRQ